MASAGPYASLHLAPDKHASLHLAPDKHARTPPLSFYRLDALPTTQPTATKHWRKLMHTKNLTKSHHSCTTHLSTPASLTGRQRIWLQQLYCKYDAKQPPTYDTLSRPYLSVRPNTTTKCSLHTTATICNIRTTSLSSKSSNSYSCITSHSQLEEH